MGSFVFKWYVRHTGMATSGGAATKVPMGKPQESFHLKPGSTSAFFMGPDPLTSAQLTLGTTQHKKST